MVQEAISEIDMDVFSRRIGPYFSWLESRIESGWQQSDSVPKDVLKEAKYLATTMRARFILGVSRDDFTKEVQRTIELFELASEAFPAESDEVDNKLKHFCKGISEELGANFLPTEYKAAKTETIVQPAPPKVEAPKIEMPKPVEAPKVEIKQPKITVQAKPKPAPKIEAKPVEKKAVKAKPIAKQTPIVKQAEKAKPVAKQKPSEKPAKVKKRKQFFIVRWVKGFIFGED